LYYFQGQIEECRTQGALQGPVDGAEYTFRDTFAIANLVYAKCGATTVLNINSAIQVSNTGNRTGQGYITNDSVSTLLHNSCTHTDSRSDRR
jgi:hypothetical protein